MTTQIVLPDADKEVGDPNPPGDMNQVITALNAMQATVWVFPSGDISGATDTANIVAAIGALGADGGTVWLAAGTFYITSGSIVLGPQQYIRGVGRWASLVECVGGAGGTFIRQFNSHYGGNGLWGGGHLNYTLDGTNAGAGAVLLEIGDGEQFELNIAVQNCTGSGSIGVWANNTIWWTEKLHGTIFVWNCTTGLQFDVNPLATTVASGSNGGEISTIASWSNPSAGVLDVASIPANTPTSGTLTVAASGSTTAVVTYTGISGNSFTGCAYVSGSATGTVATGGAVTTTTPAGSFGYLDLTAYIITSPSGGQNGVTVNNGANVYHGRLIIKGDLYGSNSVAGTYVLGIVGTQPAGAASAGTSSRIYACDLDMMVECASASATNQPYTIYFGGSGNTIEGCRGILDFTQGAGSFKVSNLYVPGNSNRFGYTGQVVGDYNLQPAYTFAVDSSTTAHSYAANFMSGASGQMYVNSGDFFEATLSADITMNLTPTGQNETFPGPQRKTIVLSQPLTGGTYNYTVTWPQPGSVSTSAPAVYWAGGPGASPTMSTGAGATDVYKLDTYDGVSWYGQAIQATVPPVTPVSLGVPLSQLGLIGQNMPGQLVGSSSSPAAGYVYVIVIPLTGAETEITNVELYVSSGGSGLTSTENYAAVYSNTGTRIGVTADQTSAWASSGLKTMALAGAPFTGTWPWVAASFVTNGGTVPTFAAGGLVALANAGATGANLIFATNGSGASSVPTSLTYSSNSTTNAHSFWAGVSSQS